MGGYWRELFASESLIALENPFARLGVSALEYSSCLQMKSALLAHSNEPALWGTF